MKVKKIIFLILSLIILNSNNSFAQDDVAEYGIAIIPEESCVKKAQLLNKEIAKNLPKLENPHNQWHVTLFQGAFTVEDIKIIKSKISKLNIKQFEIEFEDLADTDDRWIDWEIDGTRYLQKLHEKIVAIASPYYRRPLNRASTLYDLLDEKDRSQIDQYGTRGVMDQYRPHLSVFYVCPPNPVIRKIPEIIEDDKYEDIECKAKKIVIGKLAYDGHMTKVVETINLK